MPSRISPSGLMVRVAVAFVVLICAVAGSASAARLASDVPAAYRNGVAGGTPGGKRMAQAAPAPVAVPGSTGAATAGTGARQPGADLVLLTSDGNPVATGVIVGFKSVSNQMSRLVLVPMSALSGIAVQQIKVRDSDGVERGVEVKRIDFRQVLADSQAIPAMARVDRLSAALAREYLADAATQPPVALLILDETRDPEALRSLEVLDETCSEEGQERFLLADAAARPLERTSRQLVSEPTANGALRIVDCLGQASFRGMVSSTERQIEAIDLSKVANALRLWLKSNVGEDAELLIKPRPPRYTSQCPTRAQRRTSARVAQGSVNAQTGELDLRVMDFPPDLNDPVSGVMHRSENRIFEDEYSWVWGSRGSSNELFLLRVSGANDGQFVFERLCKVNLSPRGRIVGAIERDQATSLSEDVGIEAENARFAIRLNNKVTLVSTPTLRHGLVVDSFPEADRLTRAGRMYFSESANGSDLLIGHSRSRKIIYVAKLPSGEVNAEGGHREVVGGRPALRMTTPLPLRWQNVTFDLRQLGWRSAPSTRQDSPPSASEQENFRIEVVGRSIAVLGDAGLAVLSLDAEDRPRMLVNIDRADQAVPPGQTLHPLRRRFAEGRFKLIASTVAQTAGSANFAVVALYSERGVRSGQDMMAVLPVVDGVPRTLRLMDVGGTLRSRIDRVGQSLNLGDRRLNNVEPASGIMALGTNASLERFWGALIVNATAQAGVQGRPSQDLDFALGFNLHFWFNRFDRIWDFEAVGGVDQAQSLCERFDFSRLNVISVDSLPRRVIAAVDASCGVPTGAPTSNQGSAERRTLAIHDFLYDRVRPAGRP